MAQAAGARGGMGAGGRLRQNVKGKLSTTLKSWLPILQGDLFEVEDILKQYVNENPLLNIKLPMQNNFSSSFGRFNSSKNSISDKIEQLTLDSESLYQNLERQITPPLFPTQLSQEIALDIIQGIDTDGYFKEDCKECAECINVSYEEYEKIRQRFCFLEPRGVGAKDITESFSFQLSAIENIDDEVYDLCEQIIQNFHNHLQFRKHKHYQKAMKIIKNFKNPPALEFEVEEIFKIPDILITEEEGNLIVHTNDEYYPIIEIESMELCNEGKDTENYIKSKTKEARDLVDALEMRKATIRKVGLMIIDYQYDFFRGGEIKPMKLKDIAQELGYAPSTISRAISNKYLECQRGIFSLKSFFTTAIEGDVSNASLKDFLSEIIKNESHKKPLSDLKIQKMIEEKFELKIVRRTITKYRKQLNIASSSERKKLYEIHG